MAFIRAGVAEIWIGAAADAKPTGIAAGSWAHEYDTGRWFVTDDGSTWRAPRDSGYYATATHSQPTIGATTTVALAANAARLYALLVNDSNEDVYIKLGAAAVLNQGIRLNAGGGSYELNRRVGNLHTGAINAICASGGKVLLVTEGT